jgi:bifunctional NMN adenylyltransferase/nudix hydrolase
MNTPSYGVIVGRFQVNDLHDGHMELFRLVRSRHNRVIVFIGVSAAGLTRNSPLDYETRRRMIQAKFPEFSCAPLPDRETDEYWSACLDSEISTHAPWGDVILYGSRDSFLPHYHGRYKPVELTIDCPASGTAIREALSNNIMESSDFRAGIIYAVNNIRPRVFPTVDIVICRNTAAEHWMPLNAEFLLAQKPGEKHWRFVGGFADPSSPTYEDDAKREVFEETGCDINSLEYLGSAVIGDWRYRKDPDRIKTLVFLAWTGSARAIAADDICNVKWFNWDHIHGDMINPTHLPILTLLASHMEKKHATTTGS